MHAEDHTIRNGLIGDSLNCISCGAYTRAVVDSWISRLCCAGCMSKVIGYWCHLSADVLQRLLFHAHSETIDYNKVYSVYARAHTHRTYFVSVNYSRLKDVILKFCILYFLYRILFRFALYRFLRINADSLFSVPWSVHCTKLLTSSLSKLFNSTISSWITLKFTVFNP